MASRAPDQSNTHENSFSSVALSIFTALSPVIIHFCFSISIAFTKYLVKKFNPIEPLPAHLADYTHLQPPVLYRQSANVHLATPVQSPTPLNYNR